MKITDRGVFDILYATGDYSMQDIKTWMDKRQQADLRDEFAAKAMAAFIPIWADSKDNIDILCGTAYKAADAMLKARAKEST